MMAASKGSGGIKGYAKLIRKLKDINKDSEKAIKRTVSDLKNRAPAKVTKAITARYGIKAGEVTEAGKAAKGKAKVIKTSRVIDTIQLTYTGRVLTPTHFKMRPSTRPSKGKKYKVTAEIFKGQRKGFGPNVFLAPNKIKVESGDKKSETDSKEIPFQRKGKARNPIQAIKTLSIPQMVENDKVNQEIRENLDELLINRLNHNIDRAIRKK